MSLLTGIAQAATNLASWQGLRGAQIQSKIVLEGGLLTNGTFNSDGQWKDTSIVQNSYGVYYQIDLTKSFDAVNENTDTYLIHGLAETSDTSAPNYIGGGIFNNDYQFYTFGGIADRPPIGLSTVILGKVFPADPSVKRFDQGVSPNQPTDDVSDNITSGAYASSPDQGLGFYFGGMVSANRSELEWNSDDEAANHPTIASPTFIKVDMTKTDDAAFQYMTWPNGTVPRSEGALVWLPYGEKGVLVAIGGVEIPGDLYIVSPPRDTVDGPFMTELAIYDIDADTWHTQQTLETGESPTQLASFCTAVVPTQDGKSHEIFVYGGYDGTYLSDNPNVRDDLWVLSVPAFQWTKITEYTPVAAHGRQGSVCFSPNPTTMITVGGTNKLGGSLKTDTIIDVLDLNALSWTGKYNASANTTFNLPGSVVTQLKYPSAAGPGDDFQATGLNSTLDDLFSTQYPGAVMTYNPYSTSNEGGGSNEGGEEQPKGDSKNKWKVPVIATLCSVGGVAIIAALLFCCFRRRRKNKNGVNKTQQSRKNVFSWLGKSSHVDPEPEKSNTSGDTAVESNPEYYNQKGPNGEVYEAPSHVTSQGWTYGATTGPNERHEIMDHSQEESMSVRNHPFYPRSLSGDHILSPPSASVSRFSEGLSPPQNAGVVAPYEMPHDQSKEDLSQPRNGVTQNRSAAPRSAHDRVTAAKSASSGRGQSVSDESPITPIRSAVERPGHRRNASSMDTDFPSLPSPRPEDDSRMFKQVDILPNIAASPLSHKQDRAQNIAE
ncbi:hypothetical protein LTR70_001153 [Exophiala xenobiotica]|uniref:Uncharacterized protein n=1 Tax=Lithohypha guttulata TaxID=1690604 RepID=A0ABR0K834_9EURO|nr:hypothetical protein LTR24_005738 [Lithohypha guttulata]KAK5328128.1 hypothetical protein LTR70_001153 [Exophiala xenobiotica]